METTIMGLYESQAYRLGARWRQSVKIGKPAAGGGGSDGFVNPSLGTSATTRVSRAALHIWGRIKKRNFQKMLYISEAPSNMRVSVGITPRLVRLDNVSRQSTACLS